MQIHDKTFRYFIAGALFWIIQLTIFLIFFNEYIRIGNDYLLALSKYSIPVQTLGITVFSGISFVIIYITGYFLEFMLLWINGYREAKNLTNYIKNNPSHLKYLNSKNDLRFNYQNIVDNIQHENHIFLNWNGIFSKFKQWLNQVMLVNRLYLSIIDHLNNRIILYGENIEKLMGQQEYLYFMKLLFTTLVVCNFIDLIIICLITLINNQNLLISLIIPIISYLFFVLLLILLDRLTKDAYYRFFSNFFNVLSLIEEKYEADNK